jgi:hypothetical protein
MANPNPIIRKAENKYPMTSRINVTLFKSKIKEILLSSQSLESD